MLAINSLRSGGSCRYPRPSTCPNDIFLAPTEEGINKKNEEAMVGEPEGPRPRTPASSRTEIEFTVQFTCYLAYLGR